MASTPVAPFPTPARLVDEKGVLTRDGLEYLRQMQRLVNQLRDAALANGWVL